VAKREIRGAGVPGAGVVHLSEGHPGKIIVLACVAAKSI